MEEASDSVSELREQLEAAEVEEAEKKEAAASLMNQSLRTIYAQATPKGTSPVDQIGSAPLSSSSSAYDLLHFVFVFTKRKCISFVDFFQAAA